MRTTIIILFNLLILGLNQSVCQSIDYWMNKKDSLQFVREKIDFKLGLINQLIENEDLRLSDKMEMPSWAKNLEAEIRVNTYLYKTSDPLDGRVGFISKGEKIEVLWKEGGMYSMFDDESEKVVYVIALDVIESDSLRLVKDFLLEIGTINKAKREELIRKNTPVIDPISSYTFTEVEGANMFGANPGPFRTSSFDWTITQKNGGYEIKSTASSDKLFVKYSRMEGSTYIYTPVGSSRFDNATVDYVMASGKLSDYASANGEYSSRVMVIHFSDTGDAHLVYKLRK